MKYCYQCGAKLNEDGTECYSILTYEKDYSAYSGHLYCKRCAALLHRVYLAILISETGFVKMAFDDFEKRSKRQIRQAQNSFSAKKSKKQKF
jgi:hypothetical protein